MEETMVEQYFFPLEAMVATALEVMVDHAEEVMVKDAAEDANPVTSCATDVCLTCSQFGHGTGNPGDLI
jgi:hypothetical protein